MWLLMLNGFAYLVCGFATGRFRERLLPTRIVEIVTTVRETLRLHIAHEDLTVYNAVQKLLYIVVIIAGISQIVTGFAIWKPVQLSWLADLLGGFQGARLIRFIGMAVIADCWWCMSRRPCWCRALWAMLAGGPKLPPAKLARVETAEGVTP